MQSCEPMDPEPMPMMIDPTRIEPAGERALEPTFSDGSHGPWNAAR
jgi:hypothetical protein